MLLNVSRMDQTASMYGGESYKKLAVMTFRTSFIQLKEGVRKDTLFFILERIAESIEDQR
jgi:hypothetical protein